MLELPIWGASLMLLFWRSITCRFGLTLPLTTTVPFRWLFLRFRVWKNGRLKILEGICPARLQFSSIIVVKFSMVVSHWGNSEELKELLLKSIYWRLVRPDKSGIDSSSLLFDRFSSESVFMELMLDGIVPFKEFLSNLKAFKVCISPRVGGISP